MLRGQNTESQSVSSVVTARVRRYRARQRKAGLKSIQLWVPDTTRPAFIAECQRQAAKVSRSSTERQLIREMEWLIVDRESGTDLWA